MRALSVLLTAAAFTLFAPAPLGAQPTTATDAREAARRLTILGTESFKAGQYEKAIFLFRQADKLYHAPTIVLREAQAIEKKGDLLSARNRYRDIVNEPLGSDAPKPFHLAKEEAKKGMLAVEARIPTVQIILHGATPRAEVSIDGNVVPLETAMEQNPGPHTITASDAARSVTKKITLAENEHAKIDLKLPDATPPAPDLSPARLVPAPTSTASITGTPSAPARRPEETPRSRIAPGRRTTSLAPVPDTRSARSGGMPTSAMIAFGAGAMGLGGGLVGGALWISDAGSHSSRTTGEIAIAGFFIAILGAGVGVILLSSDSTPTTATISAGPGSVAVRGTF